MGTNRPGSPGLDGRDPWRASPPRLARRASVTRRSGVTRRWTLQHVSGRTGLKRPDGGDEPSGSPGIGRILKEGRLKDELSRTDEDKPSGSPGGGIPPLRNGTNGPTPG